MKAIQHHICTILNSYSGHIPLPAFLKLYFKKHPILGGKDRKILTEMAFVYYRWSKLIELESELYTRVLKCLKINLQFNSLKIDPKHPAYLYFEKYSQSISELIEKPSTFEALFPYPIALSQDLSKATWLEHCCRQSLVFIRIVPKYYEDCLKILQTSHLFFTPIERYCIALESSIKIDAVLPENYYRVQDYSSQKVIDYINITNVHNAWDCCSGAGGKSLLFKEKAPHIPLLVSDVRKSILHNLNERFKRYQIKNTQSLCLSAADITACQSALKDQKFDLIIADVPCSGSGTWARSPEQLYFFDVQKITTYTQLQQDIVNNIVAYLNPGGLLLYITCSVFQKENEQQVQEFLQKHSSLRLEQSQLINGIPYAADMMYVAQLRKVAV